MLQRHKNRPGFEHRLLAKPRISAISSGYVFLAQNKLEAAAIMVAGREANDVLWQAATALEVVE